MIVFRYRNESIYHKWSSEFLGVFIEFLRLKVKCYVFRLLLKEHQGLFIEEGFSIWSSGVWDLHFDTLKVFSILSGDVTCHWSSYDPMSLVIILALIVFFSLLSISSSFPFFSWFSFWISIPFMFMSYPASLLSFPVASKVWYGGWCLTLDSTHCQDWHRSVGNGIQYHANYCQCSLNMSECTSIVEWSFQVLQWSFVLLLFISRSLV